MIKSCDWLRVPLAASLAVWLTACSSGYAPVSDRTRSATSSTQPATSSGNRAALPNPGSYTVVRGDTLYSISWRYGLDYRQVAAWNNIDGRYQIFPGQKLTLLPAGQPAAVSATPARTQAPASTTPAQAEGSTTPAAAAPARPAEQTASRPVATPSVPAARPVTTSAPASTGPVRWQWPAAGNIIAGFSTRADGNKGVDIAGNAGDPVFAASDGRVVYAGSGLLGYGNLVIINHNHQFLSAYAHNSRILVNENDMVKGGEKIAEMGNTGTDRVKLHFEIRQDGKPVDPVRFLPKR
ncbi:peptidoglycan DD-metalloendopeptidase family protein [Nitrincola alkalilacustris]|uniref:peptidoglycan DD-metalloendopeptidase family protein n=1 Tax=Nitrincola alkalilacustris TaxID=1571224 RepID=UPI00124C157A|nr:peptidoglycan DD-metalloendopeptidase family protein [Nitrincola alkalilacustris]